MSKNTFISSLFSTSKTFHQPSLLVGDRLCPSCRGYIDEKPDSLPEFNESDHFIVLNSIETTETGWKVQGKGELFERICPRCLSMFQAVVKEIPVESKALVCPNCKKSEIWEFKVSRVIRTDGGHEFEFEAELICKECQRKQVFRRLLSNVFDIVKIEVGPGGITFGKG